jgi:RNA polymerase sigma-70 factor, ECF subfamily
VIGRARVQKSAHVSPYREVKETEDPRRAAARSDIPEFPEIFRDHAAFLWRTLVNLGVPRHDAQDLCQEVMITVHRRLPDFDGRSLRGWLYGICARVASDYRRSARVRHEIPHASVPDLSLPAEQPEQVDRARELERARQSLERLSEDKRAAFVLFELEGLTLAEVAEALGVPLQTVYSRIKAARETLRADLGNASVAKGGVREAG